ncbi:MAG: hypothetical protein GY697_11735 [Desulfobacterales bacterium]|nr:hypothetical protein [Desulfobacterales bacterium]
MNLVINLLIIVCLVIALLLVLNIINILQAGSRKAAGRSMRQILGVDPETATYDDIEKLPRSEKMRLFHAADVPEFEDIKGEYRARLLSGGVLGPSSAWFTHHIFPTGKPTFKTEWVGKSFQSQGDNTGQGYNIFAERTGASVNTRRLRKINTRMAPTKIGKGGKPVFRVDYSRFNPGLINSMRDEIRQVNANLYIGAGYMTLGGGYLNPAPFTLEGPVRGWVGPDT